MSAQSKKAQQLARQLFKTSLADGAVSAERVAGVLEYIEKHQPAHAMQVLKTYQRLVAQEVARSQAVVEHAGQVSAAILQSIASAMTRRYQRPVSAVAKPNPSLLAGLRVRVGDDVFENSVAGQLATLAAHV